MNDKKTVFKRKPKKKSTRVHSKAKRAKISKRLKDTSMWAKKKAVIEKQLKRFGKNKPKLNESDPMRS